MDYIAQADVEKYLGISLTGNGQNLFNLMSPLMQEVIDQYCNRTWNFSNPVTEYFDAVTNGIYFVEKPSISTTAANVNFPLAGGIISVTVGGVAYDLSNVYNYKSYVKLLGSTQGIPLTGLQTVKIMYNSAAVAGPPSPVKLAMIEWMARKIQTSQDAGKEATNVQAGTVSVQYARDKMGGIPDFVKMVLDNYRLPPVDR